MTNPQPAYAGRPTPVLGCKLPGTIHLQGAPVVITALRGKPLYCHKTDELMQRSSAQSNWTCWQPMVWRPSAPFW